MVITGNRLLMIIDLNKKIFLSDNKFDYVIIGAGIAGIVLANKLSSKNKRVAICEGGDYDFSENSQNIYKGKIVGDEYFDLDICRLRFFGGSSNHWQGMCRTFDEIDFQRLYLGREFQWPIIKNDIDHYLDESCNILEINNQFNDQFTLSKNIKSVQFNFSPPVRFREKFFDKFKKNKNIFLFLNSNLVDVHGNNKLISSAKFQIFNNFFQEIYGKKFIFAMGGIENSRYLLWIRQKYQDKFFHLNLPIGEYWMEHPHFTLGQIIVDQKKINKNYYSLSSDIQKYHKILNCCFRIKNTNYKNTKKLIQDLFCIDRSLGEKIFKEFKKKFICGAELFAAWEQSPVKSNKIILDNIDKDYFKIPRTILLNKKNQLDRDTLKKSLSELNKYLLRYSISRIKLNKWILENEDYPVDDAIGGNHHMGGTRMHNLPSLGVVNSDCKVHGSENLYIVGSSIFTTGGHNNPTLPIVQFTLRLAEFLLNK